MKEPVEEEQHQEQTESGGWCGWRRRHAVVLLLFLCTTVSYSVRVALSVAVLDMTDTARHNLTGYPVFEWSAAERDTLLSSFFWGYVVLQVPAGVLANRVGGGVLLMFAMTITAALTLAMPAAAEYGGWWGALAIRASTGLVQGAVYPAVHGVLAACTPPHELGRAASLVYAGSLLGTVVQLGAGGALCAWWGWRGVFYCGGAACVLWGAAWGVWGDSRPPPRTVSRTLSSTPWRQIWSSPAFWAVLVAHSAQSLGFWTLLTEMPAYLAHVLHVDIKTNGLMSSLPYAAMYLLSFVFSWSSDLLVNRRILSLGRARKLFNTIAFWGPACSLLVLSYLPRGHVTAAVLLLTVTVGLNGAHYVGFLVSHIDIAPNFSSTLMGFTNGIGNVFSILAPLSVSLVVQDDSSADEWRKVFLISVSAYGLANLFYLLFASGEVQPWNSPDKDSTRADIKCPNGNHTDKNSSPLSPTLTVVTSRVAP